MIEAKLTGAAWAAVAALTVGFGMHVHLAEVPVHERLFSRVRAEAAEFWRLIEAGEEPDPDYGRDARVISDLFPLDDGTEIDLSGDNRLPGLLARRERRKAYVRSANAWIGRADAEVKAKVGPHERAHVPGWRISWAGQERAGHYVPPSSTRVLRIKPHS